MMPTDTFGQDIIIRTADVDRLDVRKCNDQGGVCNARRQNDKSTAMNSPERR
jgi:hypothetical protein